MAQCMQKKENRIIDLMQRILTNSVALISHQKCTQNKVRLGGELQSDHWTRLLHMWSSRHAPNKKKPQKNRHWVLSSTAASFTFLTTTNMTNGEYSEYITFSKHVLIFPSPMPRGLMVTYELHICYTYNNIHINNNRRTSKPRRSDCDVKKISVCQVLNQKILSFTKLVGVQASHRTHIFRGDGAQSLVMSIIFRCFHEATICFQYINLVA